MQLEVFPGSKLVMDGIMEDGIHIPGDKSLSHRAALFAALAEGESVIENFLVSGVTRAMLNALTSLAVDWNLKNDILTVSGRGLDGFETPREPINCGNSATTMRLLAGAIAATGIEAELTGSAGLQRRPMGRIVEPLKLMGVDIDATENGSAPLKIHARKPGKYLSAVEYSLPVASAQVKSCLLLAALRADGPTILSEPGPSRDHTERMLRGMGVNIENIPDMSKSDLENVDQFQTRMVPPLEKSLKPLNFTLPGDISSAAFLIVAALITPGSEIKISNIGLNPTRTGIIDALNKMGADIQVLFRDYVDGTEPSGDVIVKHHSLKGIEVSGSLVVRMIDEFPAFAIAAAYAQGTTIVRDAIELRHKESDRITALITELRAIGIDAEETEDGFIIHGGKPVMGGTAQVHGDHRLAMSLAVSGLASEKPVIVDGAEIMNESFPEFLQILNRCGAQFQHEG